MTLSRRLGPRMNRGRIATAGGGGAALVTPYVRWRADQGVTLGTATLATGATPPAVTLSGAGLALTTPALVGAGGIQVEVNDVTGGTALGQAKFRVSYNNGATWAQTGITTAATYALDGDATGITLNFPAGPYANDNVYKATVSAWLDAVLGISMAVGTASKRPIYYVAGMNSSKPALLFDQSNDEIQTSDAGLIAKMTGPLANTLMAVVRVNDATQLGAIFGAGAAVATNRTRRWGLNTTGTGVWRVDAVDDAGVVAAQETLSTEPHVDLEPHVVAWRQTGPGGTVTFQVDTDAPLISAAAFVVGTPHTITKVDIGARPDSVSDSFLGAYVSEVSFFDVSLSNAETTVAVADRNTTWGFTVPGPSIVFEGDSLTNCFGSVSGVTMPNRVTITGSTKYNVATNGHRLDLNMLGDYAAQVRVKYDLGNPNNVVWLEGGNNDIQAGRTAAQVYADMQTYAALCRATGFRVGIENVSYRDTAPFNAVCDTLKGLLDADSSFCDVYCDTLALVISELALHAESPGVPGVVYSDTAHFTDYFYDLRAALIQSKINSILV